MTMTAAALPAQPADPSISTKPLRVALFNVNMLFARGLEMLLGGLSGGMLEVIGSGREPGPASDFVRRSGADLALCGVRLAADGDIPVLRMLRTRNPLVRLVALVEDGDPRAAVSALRAGANAVLHSGAPPETLVAALQAVALGVAVFPEPVSRLLVAGRIRPDSEVLRRLDDEDRRVWRLVADGLDSAEIGVALSVSERTAKRRVATLLDRIGATNRVQAAAMAGRAGLLDPDEP